MIIYWSTLEKDASDVSTIPDYVSSNYIPSIHFARNIYWEGHPRKSGVNTQIQNYIASTDFTRGLYPPASDKLLALGPSGDLPLPGKYSGVLTSTKAFSACASVNQSVVKSTIKDVTLGTEISDPGNNFASSQFTVPTTGWYSLSAKVYLISPEANNDVEIWLYNVSSAAAIDKGEIASTAGNALIVSVGGIYYLTANHIISVKVRHGSSVDKSINGDGKISNSSSFSGAFLFS